MDQGMNLLNVVPAVIIFRKGFNYYCSEEISNL